MARPGLLYGYYLDEYEVSEDGRLQIMYLGGDAYTAPMAYMRNPKVLIPSWELVNICRDHLGSVTHIADVDGNLMREYSYDAWGNPRYPGSHKLYDNPNDVDLYLGRGYTGHEHLPRFGLINMNARLYDPETGRFLSPDPYVQMPDCPQNFNRYSYCMNNPLRYVDMDGKFWHLLAGAAIGGVVNWAIHGFKFNAKGLGYFGIGAAAGFLCAGVGAGISSILPTTTGTAGGFAAGFWGTSGATTATTGFFSGALIGGGAGLAEGFVTGLGNGLLDNNGIWQSLGNGFVGALGTGVSGAFVGGLVSGIDAATHGRDFWIGNEWIDDKVYKLPDGDLPVYHQYDQTVGCAQQSLNSISEYKGAPTNIKKFEGADFAQLAGENKFSTKTFILNNTYSDETIANSLGAQLSLNHPIAHIILI